MSGGGKTQTATQQVQIPPEVMARYRAVNTRAENVARQPFQPYSYDPNAFVAPLTATQMAGMQNINQAAGMSQPYFQTAAGLTLGGAQGVGPLTQEQIGYYQNPYTQSVVGSTLAGLQQQQGQQLSQQQAEAIKAGAFGGDRAGIQRAQLMGQQNLATAQAIAPLYQQGYNTAVQTAQGQQGVLASDLQRQLAAGQQLGGLGAAGQQAALAGAQAQLGAGTAEQQTQQAGLQALYNQFLQERGYPFQVAQFLANIAMGTGALSGSTTQTTQPAPFFSDEKNKRNMRVLGKDPETGLNIIAYDDADDLRNARKYGEPMPPKRVSYSAQEIEERAPGLVHEVGGNKVVGMADGGAPPFTLKAPSMGSLQGLGALQVASPPAAGGAGIPIQRSAAAPNLAPKATGTSLGTPAGKGSVDALRYLPGGGLLSMMTGRGFGDRQSMGGMVSEPGNYATGGSVVGPEDMRAILAAIGQPLEFYGGKGLYGGAAKGGAGSPGYVPQGQMATPKLVTAGGLPRMAESGLSQAAQTGSQIAGLAKMGQSALVGGEKSRGLLGRNQEFDPKQGLLAGLGGGRPGPSTAEPPAPTPREDKIASMFPQVDYPQDYETPVSTARGGFMRHHYDLGGSLPYETDDQGKDPLADIVKEGAAQQRQLATPGKAPAPTPGLGSELMQIGSLAKSAQGLGSMLPAGVTEGISGAASGIGSGLAGLGTAAAEGAGAIGSGLAAGGTELLAMLPLLLSDARMKDNIEPVGELYDGQPIYRYNMKGSPKTQLGLMAQDVERNGHEDAVAGLGGLKMVDYKRATDVAAGLAARNHAYRGGYQEGGMPEEESLPMLLAALQERDAEAPRPAGLGAAPPVVMSDAEPAPLVRPREPEAVREPGLVVAERTPDQPGATPVRTEEAPAAGVAPRQLVPARAATGVSPPTPPARPEEAGELSPQALRAYTAERARALGLDPNFATAVFGGESGFRANARGDDNSSFNVAQLHYGNASERYPRPGLGDVFTRETGLDARDPNNAKAVIDWSLKHAAENGWNAWTVARNLQAGKAGGAGGERVTPGLAGPGRGPMDPASAPFLTLARRAMGMQGEGTPTEKALTSENFWVPALAGIGSMLASKSPYLGSAVGEGLVGGTSAYTALQKQQQEMGESRMRTEAQRADIAQKAFFEYAGRGMVRYQKPDGTYGVMNFADYFALPRDRRPPVDPAFREYLDTLEPAVSGGRPAGAAGTPDGRPSGVPSTVDLLPEDRTRAFDIARKISLESRATIDQRRKDDFFQPQREAATSAQGIMQLTMPMAATIMALPTGQSLGTSGVFTNAIQPYVATMNNLVEAATGRRGAVIDPAMLGDIESVNKEIARLRAQTTTEAGQRAVTALDEMAKGIVSLKNAREGQTRILSKVLSDTQRNIDKDRWFSQWVEAGSSAPGGERDSFSDYARLSGQEANQEFDRRYSQAFYGEERKQLQRMMEERIGRTTSTGGQPMTVFEYVQKNAAQMPAEQILQLANDYGDNTFRYFGISPQRIQQLRQELRNREQPRG